MAIATKESDWVKVCNREMTHDDWNEKWAPEHARRMVRGDRTDYDAKLRRKRNS